MTLLAQLFQYDFYQHFWCGTNAFWYHVLEGIPVVKELQKELFSGEVTEQDVRTFLDSEFLVEAFVSGQSYEYDHALAGLAVALVQVDQPYAAEVIQELADMHTQELLYSHYVALLCLRRRQEFFDEK